MCSLAALVAMFAFSTAVPAQSGSKAPSQKAAASFDPHDLTGKWNRVSPFQTYSNVPGGANELQGFILGQSTLR